MGVAYYKPPIKFDEVIGEDVLRKFPRRGMTTSTALSSLRNKPGRGACCCCKTGGAPLTPTVWVAMRAILLYHASYHLVSSTSWMPLRSILSG